VRSTRSRTRSSSHVFLTPVRLSSIASFGARGADIITETMTARGHALRIALMAALLLITCPLPAWGAKAAAKGAIPSTKRERKEAFVSGNDGTTFTEVSAIVAIVPLGAAARRAFDVARGIRTNAKGETIDGSGAKVTSATHGIVADFVFLVAPAVAAMMSPEVGMPAAAGILSLVLHVGFRSIAKRDDWSFPDGVSSTFGDESKRHAPRPYLAAYRAAMTLATACAILAIDFHAFPRRLGKTRHHGIGLMDVGSGSFVLANALVSREARGVPPTKECHFGVEPYCLGYNLVVALHNTLPLLICGTVRAVAVYAFDYQQPVEEYGVYWNFFFTLAAVCAAGQLVKIPPKFSALAGVLVLAAHQHFLTNRGIGEFIRGDARGDDWHLLNKEGVFSLPGYYALYLMGVGVGNLLERSVLALHDVRTSEQPSDKASKPSRHGKAGDKWAWQWLLRLGILAGWFWGAALACHLYVEPVSRQSANAAYVLWMMAFNTQTLCAFVFGALLFPNAFGRTAKLLDVCNRRLLVVFLVANATTGIVNVCTDTMEMTDVEAWVAVFVHMAATCAAAVAVDFLLGSLKGKVKAE